MSCRNPKCTDGKVPILRLQHGVDNIHGFVRHPLQFIDEKKKPKELPSIEDTAPCPDCRPKERAKWERSEFEKTNKKPEVPKNVKVRR